MSSTNTATLDVPVPTLSQLATFAAIIVALLQFVGGAIGEASAFAGLLAGAAIGWTANYRYLPALMILCFPAFGVSPERFPTVVQVIPLAGAGFGAPLGVMLAAACRAVLEATRPATYRIGWPSRTPVLLFLVALVVAGLGALAGRSAGLNAWSGGVRAVLAVGGLFWGYMVVRRAGASTDRIPNILVRITLVGCLLFAATLLHGHFIFLLVGMSTALLGYFARERRVLPLVLAAVVAAAGLALGSLTTAAIVVIALGSLLLARLPGGVLRRWVLGTAVAGTVLASVVAIWAVLRFGNALAIQLAVHTARSDGILQYAMYKLMADRGSLWLSAVQQISGGPYWIVPAERPLYPILGLHAGKEWLSGPHNTILQVIRNTGLIGGPAVMGLMAIALRSGSRALVRTREPLIRAFAAAFVAIAASGIMTGDFPVSDMGFFLWTLAGVTIGLYEAEQFRPVAGETRKSV